MTDVPGRYSIAGKSNSCRNDGAPAPATHHGLGSAHLPLINLAGVQRLNIITTTGRYSHRNRHKSSHTPADHRATGSGSGSFFGRSQGRPRSIHSRREHTGQQIRHPEPGGLLCRTGTGEPGPGAKACAARLPDPDAAAVRGGRADTPDRPGNPAGRGWRKEAALYRTAGGGIEAPSGRRGDAGHHCRIAAWQ